MYYHNHWVINVVPDSKPRRELSPIEAKVAQFGRQASGEHAENLLVNALKSGNVDAARTLAAIVARRNKALALFEEAYKVLFEC